MSGKIGIRDMVSIILMAISVVVLGICIFSSDSISDSAKAARKFEKSLEKRLVVLEKHVANPSLDHNVPDDMVIYRYVNDTLRSWSNQFPVNNDDIVERMQVAGPDGPRNGITAPLSHISDFYSYTNLGSKWYLVKSEKITTQGGEKRQTISGLEIVDPNRFSIVQMSSREGQSIKIRGLEQFKIVRNSSFGMDSRTSTLVWISLIFFILAALSFLKSRPSLKNLFLVLACSYAALALIYFWGRNLQNIFPIFSPVIFASGNVLYSLGALIVINLAIVIFCAGLYLAKDAVASLFSKGTGSMALKILVMVGSAALLAYTALGLRCVARNSDINLELYKISELSGYSVIVYLTFIAILFCVPMLQKIISPGKMSHGSRALYSLSAGLILLVITSVLGFSKEKSRLQIWSNQLSIDRDIALELQLCRSENLIANDPVVANLTIASDANRLLTKYIVDNYFFGISQDYNIAVFVYRNYERDEQAAKIFSESILGGEKISKDSRFMYSGTNSGVIHYTGVFVYINPTVGYTSLLLGVEAKSNREEKGYASILGLTAPGSVNIPSKYSYARYSDRTLKYFKGSYAYPTRADDKLFWQMYVSQSSNFTEDGFIHFVTRCATNPSTEEAVLISRPATGFFNYLMAFLFIALIVYVALSVFNHLTEEPGPEKIRSYYRSRLSYVLTASLTVTLIVMMTVSVIFVYKRNDENMHLIMSDKINAVRTLVESEIRAIPPKPGGLNSQDIYLVLQRVSKSTSSDITLYTPEGHVLVSTVPEVFDRMMLGSRINEDAFEQISILHKRYYLHKERLEDKAFYSMYAPMFDEEGQIRAIICSPYSDDSFDFELDAILHSSAIIIVFLILLLLSRLISTMVVDRMFLPLREMGSKMKQTNINSLDKINYDRDDEILALVTSYNRMVDDLAESSAKLAQAERDKAWSGMARQVAHEIKNPLTPMKLQLQRLIRMKSKGDEGWVEKFDEVSKIVLDHIDILSDTANEFSVIAKLPTEENTEIDLDTLIQQEIAMFDSSSSIKFEYIGLENAVVIGPKPQLTRVIVNLLTNAVQALSEKEGARVFVSLRNADDPAYYDISVEDNGDGVAAENLDKLFTPSFTTKSSGSGLGLAISRSILERCNATISYSRSFSLGGASFIIKYPKKGN